MDQSDFVMSMLDIGENELKKNFKNISLDKLQNFLEMSIRTSATNAD